MLPKDSLVYDTQRLAALYRTQILDSEPEKRFDVLVQQAKQYFQVKTVLISFVDKGRQWFKAVESKEKIDTNVENSFCAHAIEEDEFLFIEDALLDKRFAKNPNVIGGPKIRFYAGAVIRSVDKQPLGTICIIDSEPRAFFQSDFDMLSKFARMVEVEMAARQLKASTES